MTDNDPNFDVTRHEDQPIIIAHGYHLAGGAVQVIRDLGVVLDRHLTALDQPAYVIFDFSTLDITFGQVVQAMAASTRNVPGSLRDPRIIQSIFVSTNSLLEFSSKAFGQNQYGGLSILNVATLDEALAHVQQHRAQAS